MRRSSAALALTLLLSTAGCGGSDTTTESPGATVRPSAVTRDLQLRTTDGLTIGASFFPAEAPDRGVTVLVANGNGGYRHLREPLAMALSDVGLSVLLFDYRGYGNAGQPSEPGLATDIRAARKLLVDWGTKPDRLIYFGESLGTSVVTELALEHPPAGILLRSPFTTYAAVGIDAFYPDLPVPIQKGDRFATIEHVARLDVPMVIVYGTEDDIVPPRETQAVAGRAKRLVELVAVPGKNHNDRALLSGDELVGAVLTLTDHIT